MLRIVGAGHPRFFSPPPFSMKRSALCLAILCALSHPSAWAETQELWAYGVSKDGGWYDTTKTWSGDSEMCWAATAANMINWWQHWDTNYNSSAPQGTVAVYSQLKTDYGQDLPDTSALVGIEWWFNANTTLSGQKWKYDETQEKLVVKNSDVFPTEGKGDAPFSGYYKNQVKLKEGLYYNESLDADGYNLPLTYEQASSSLISVFKDGQTTVGLGISTGGNIGHSITMWGLEYDTDSNTVSKLYVTDSDDYGGGLIALTCEVGKEDKNMHLKGDGHYSYLDYYVDNFVTLDLNSLNKSAGVDSVSGYASNSYVVKNGAISDVATVSQGGQLDVDKMTGDVTFNGTTKLSSASIVYELALHAGIDGVYKQINDVDFGGNSVSMSLVRLEAQGDVTANCASLEVKNSTLIGQSILLSNSTEVKMTNAWIEAAGNVTADTATLSLDSATFSGAKVTLTAGTVEMKNGVVDSKNERGSAEGTTFKGTGTIKNMTITGGSLISGNSPGLMTLSGDQLATVELSFYLGAAEDQEMASAGSSSKIVLNTTLGSGVLEGTKTGVSSGFLLTQGTTLSGDITLSVWNVGSFFNMNDDKATPRYFSEGSYIQVIAFGEGVSYRDVLGVNFILGESIVGEFDYYSEEMSYDLSLMAVSDYTGGATWHKQVRTDGVYLVLSALPVYDVPEPATGVLVLTGLGLLLRRRRRGLARCARR